MSKKATVRAAAEARFFQCVVYDSKMRRRLILVYICGAECFFADDFFSLFDRDKALPGPAWLREQLINPPAFQDRIDWTGRSATPQGAAPAESEGPIIVVPEGESLSLGDAAGDEAGIKQS